MKLVIPVSDVDLEKAKLLAKWIVNLGQMQEEHVTVVATMRASWDIEPVIESLKPGFKTTELKLLSDECEEGWPESANHLFYNGMLFMSECAEPVYWFEADCFPTRPSWFQELKSEYVEKGKPYLGVCNTSRFYDRVTNKLFEEGEHMVGTGIYPPYFVHVCKSIHHISRMPWDVYIGPEVRPQCAHTDLIAHRWGTCNYRREDGILVCDDTPHKWHKYASPVPDEAAVIHGCKDLSLYNIFHAL